MQKENKVYMYNYTAKETEDKRTKKRGSSVSYPCCFGSEFYPTSATEAISPSKLLADLELRE